MAITQSTTLPLIAGFFTIAFHRTKQGECVSISYGNLEDLPVIRIHSSCLFGESFHGLDCDCAEQLTSTLKTIKENAGGAVIYHFAEGRGIGLENKIQALELQRTKKIDTVEAFAELGFKPDVRNYDVALAALSDLGASKIIKLATQNPHKIAVLEQAGYTIAEILHPVVKITPHNKSELLTKKYRLGYDIADID